MCLFFDGTHELSAVSFLDKKVTKIQEQNEASSAQGHTPGPPFCSGMRSLDFRPCVVLFNRKHHSPCPDSNLLYQKKSPLLAHVLHMCFIRS